MTNCLSEATLKRRAREAGYRIEKGFQHYTVGGGIYTYGCPGERETGYLVIDTATGSAVWGSYNQTIDHAWSLEDVENFLKEVYESNGLEW